DTADMVLMELSDSLPSATYPSVGSDLEKGEDLHFMGFGCQDISETQADGILRSGENQITDVNSFAQVWTPTTSPRAILGSPEQSGLCFGDSGGPAIRVKADSMEVVALAHAVADQPDGRLSFFVNHTSSENRAFLQEQNERFHLNIQFGN